MMRWLGTLLGMGLLLLGLQGQAFASPSDVRQSGDISGARADADLHRVTFEHEIRLDLGLPSPVEVARFEAPDAPWNAPLRFRLAELPPESLFLRLPLGEVGNLYVTADLGADQPRLDAVDGDTYFSTGAELALVGGLRLFLEDFQPASGVVGGGVVDVLPAMLWDGHQIQVGLRLDLAPGVCLEGGPVLYALSASGRPDGVGARAAICGRF